ncbi:Eco57I restriction-modification methylase domain-containing protein [Candidatus Halobonum tyrrellensis]|uniref:site-specific DNA-methyltransferase (adenine-specific) n=1 Tax=Candidatus Halobonum tyrrellensis G22 TaxID=1324957 RepID=V4HJB3_9EURY|nr:TaqI-like C-terminal specificity domain-containing protein [Candidatus Halobonum tyrrellensis]ESP88009.1 N-6 DNA Methylase/Eco57I restriction endonuclease [Candidatus Halobonum tyrrellensis G22]
MSQATLPSGPYVNSDLFSGHYLDERVGDLDGWDCDAEADEAFEALDSHWDGERELVEGYNEDTLLGSWIDVVLDALGYDTIQETSLPDTGGYIDRVLYDSAESRRDAMAMKQDGELTGTFGTACALLEAKRWDEAFTERFSEQRSYRDASHQVKYYLEHTPESLTWGILTNGRKWRLYGTKDYATETYYEVDLPELLESGDREAFKYFYAFFRPEAFRETGGTSFLDRVWNESETAAQELGEDLQDNVFTALRVLGEGFVETNDLDIDPDDEAARDELKEQSLVLLYRLMFVLYAESRQLISPDDPARADEFHENFSLDALRREIHEDVSSGGTFDGYSEYSTSMWGQLQDLFRLVDAGEESLGIPPYNGGLFDDGKHEFLANNEVADRYVAEVVYRLGTTRADDRSGYVLADYADLDTRHLGTIYEGLLEHEFRIAPEQYAAVSADGGQVWKPATEVSVADAVETVDRGELYVVNDEGERKATGAYYTPDYVVAYIVEETVDPLIDEIKADIADAEGLEPGDKGYIAPFLERVRGLTVLDPAMGSGHFLTKATGYLTEQVMEVIREQEIQGYDEQDIRRIVARECIYGVDVNGMAVELAKLSMWLETLATDQPLAFLDHHLKTGNSLVGSDITEVLSDDAADEGGQLTLMQALARVRRDTLEHVMELMADLLAIDNETLADVKSMEGTYDEIRSDPLYGRLFEMANVHTAERFGVSVPDGVYEEMAGAIESESEWSEVRERDWFRAAQATADEEDFFHWELEYPEVFFDADGKKRADGGFDAVVGNPPYVRQEHMQNQSNYFSTEYQVYTSAADLYTYFVENGHDILKEEGHLGYIVSNKFIRAEYGEPLRDFLRKRAHLDVLCDFRDLPVFGSAVSAYPMLLLFEKDTPSFDSRILVHNVQSLSFNDLRQLIESNGYDISQRQLGSGSWPISNPESIGIFDNIEDTGKELEEVLESNILRGILTGLNDAFIIGADTREHILSMDRDSEKFIFPLMRGNDAERYLANFSDQYLIRIPSGWTTSNSGIKGEKEAWRWFSNEFPGLSDHLSDFMEEAKSRYDRGEYWWELRSCGYYSAFESEKIVYPEISDGPRFSLDRSGRYTNNKCFIIPSESREIVALLNSTLGEFWAENKLSSVRGGYLEYRTVHVSDFPIPTTDHPDLHKLVDEMVELLSSKQNLNVRILDHLGTYQDGPALSDIGFTQPPENAADSILQETTEQKPNLRVGRVEVVRESDTTVEIRLTARYKPDDPDEYDTDQWGYTETDPLPALRITDLTEGEADLIEAFVPVAVDEAGGFAGFRETATKTNSLVDRLRALTLPRVDDVREGLESYIETTERAEELERKIERTDELIDEIVYDLYGLTDEEIEIVEEAVGE